MHEDTPIDQVTTSERTERTGLTVILLFLILISIAVASFFAVYEIKKKTEEEIQGVLSTILETTHEALVNWVDDRLDDMSYWTSRPDVLALVEKQLLFERSGSPLPGSPHTGKLREILRPLIRDHNDLGFNIVSPSGINIASQRDVNVGQRNLLYGKGDYFDAVFRGIPFMTPPIRPEMPFPDKKGNLSKAPVMFLGVPIFDSSRRVIAALIVRSDPTIDFTRIAKLGRIGASGETYLFDREGKLITESRFDNHLIKAGLIGPGERGILAITIRDPGVNLLEGKPALRPPEERPLTLMARSATAGKSGAHMKGYNDYRGIPVAGVWRWDDRLNMGMATEIDYDEAFTTYNATRRLMLGVLAFTAIVFSVFSTILIRHRKRAIDLKNKALVYASEARRINADLEMEIGERKLAQEELWRSESSLSRAQKIAHLGNWEWNIRTGDLEWSDEIYRIFGFEPQAFNASYEAFLDRVHPDDRESVVNAVKAAVEGRTPYDIEHRIIRSDGKERTVHEVGEVMRDKSGDPAAMIGIVHDITERRETEARIGAVNEELAAINEELSRSNDELEREISERIRVEEALNKEKNFVSAVIQSAAMLVVVLDREGKIVQFNRACEKTSGYAGDEVTGRYVWDFLLLPEQVDGVKAVFRELRFEVFANDHENYWVNKSGEKRLVAWSNSILKGTDGEMEFVIAMGVDVTERREAQERVRMLLDSTAEAIYGLDLKGRCTFANRACLKLTGYERVEDLLGKNMHALIHHTRPDGSPYPEKKCRIYEAFMKGEGTHSDDDFLWRSDGTSFPAEYWSYPTRRGDEIVGSVVTFIDITERKAAETEIRKARLAAEAASRAKSEFLANMSHEIRTPMTAIIGMSELLADTNLTDEQAGYLKTIERGGETLLALINDILDLSKIEAGRVELEEIDFDLRQELEKTAGIFEMRAKSKGIDLRLHYPQDLPQYVKGDPVRLRQVLFNLLGNAVKFTKKGEIRLEVKPCSPPEESSNSTRFAFSVRDTGIGIAEENLLRIFEEFGQADSSTTRLHGGTGLGLTISKRLAGLMGGELGVESKVGEGSIFFFTVNLKKAAPAAAPSGKELTPVPASRAVKSEAAILLVDDSEDNRLLISTYLGSTPYRLETAVNGQEGVDRFKAGGYDLILMDMQMPVMDGYAATREIRRFEKETDAPATPVIAFTAHALKEEVDKCLSAGCTDHLAKPIKRKSLMEAIEKHLKEAR